MCLTHLSISFFKLFTFASYDNLEPFSSLCFFPPPLPDDGMVLLRRVSSNYWSVGPDTEKRGIFLFFFQLSSSELRPMVLWIQQFEEACYCCCCCLCYCQSLSFFLCFSSFFQQKIPNGSYNHTYRTEFSVLHHLSNCFSFFLPSISTYTLQSFTTTKEL